MMLISRVNRNKSVRRSLEATRSGLVARYERPSTLGGFYTENMVYVPWPWVEEED